MGFGRKAWVWYTLKVALKMLVTPLHFVLALQFFSDRTVLPLFPATDNLQTDGSKINTKVVLQVEYCCCSCVALRINKTKGFIRRGSILY